MLGVAVALYALGLTLQELHEDHGTQLVVISVILGCVATVVFVADLVYLGSGPISRAWSSRKPRLQLGRLDYVPEFLRASTEVSAVLSRISVALTTSTAKMNEQRERLQKESDAKKRQAIATVIAADIDVSSGVFKAEALVLDENGLIMREAIAGYLKISTDDTADLEAFRDTTRGLANSIKILRKSMRDLRGKVRWLRKLNLSAALNQSTERQWKALGEYGKAQTRLLRISRQMESMVKRKLLILFIQRLVLHRGGSPSGSA